MNVFLLYLTLSILYFPSSLMGSNSTQQLGKHLANDASFLKVLPLEPRPYHHGWGFDSLGLGGKAYYEKCLSDYKQVPGKLYSLHYKSDGLIVKGVLLTPENFDAAKNYPTVIYNRGGHREFGSFTVCKKKKLADMFANHGYLVFIPQLRGVAGGEGQEEWGGAEINDILTLERIASRSGLVEKSKLYMVGWSRGAMSTWLAIKQGSKVNAAVTIAGPTDLFLSAKTRPDLEKLVAAQLVPGFENQRYQAYRERSSFFWPEKLKDIPLLSLQGTKDWRVDVLHAKKLELVLAPINPRFKVIYYKGEGHELKRVSDQAYADIRLWLDMQSKSQAPPTTVSKEEKLPQWIVKTGSLLPAKPLPEGESEKVLNELKLIWKDANRSNHYRIAAKKASRLFKKYPTSFRLQSFYAMLLGDAAVEFSEKLRGEVQLISVKIMEKLIEQTEGQTPDSIAHLKNEYFWQTAQHLRQFRLGESEVAAGRKGYYSMLVGGAWYAHQLMGFDRIALARRWAKKSIEAWKEFRKYNTTNNNSYYHYALALGILGRLKEMDQVLTTYRKQVNISAEHKELVELKDMIDDHIAKGRMN